MADLTEKQKALLDELLKDFKGDAKDFLGQQGLIKEITKRALESALEGELTDHLGYEANDPSGRNSGNSRNGRTSKSLQTTDGELNLQVPRDRNGSFEPQIVRKRQRRLEGLDEKIIALYARGLSTREIQDELIELYGTEVSATLISNVTNSVLEDVQAWQARPLDPVYPILYFDCLFVKSRQEGPVRNKAVYLALGINLLGEKELLGMWLADTEGAKFWLTVFNELKSRGVQDCFIACVDGLKGLPEAIEAVYPETRIQLCIVHQVRNSLSYVSWKDRKAVAASLRMIYTAPTEDAARAALTAFDNQWGTQYSAIVPGWERNWERLTPFFDYPPEIRKVVYTTNAIESLNYSLRKVIKGRGAFPHDEAIRKLLYLGLRNVAKKWTMPIRDWKAALNQFIILYGDRVPV
ncbi:MULTISPECIES: IS256 family transposase [unclassified Ketobacter]|uniref:IS256 family transposase n=1 Tax=unclassified Ketobacter TaxID=2639109 RepID=UPI000F1191E4|nr:MULTISPECIES: IS256 family transposase [unclassified Ketobacter]RLT87430.1 MAG: IS256 family transposase [Ketobacter sp. GenoA1]RLT94244.1 MAG: IS256 family transposase [Ketobacter sp.]